MCSSWKLESSATTVASAATSPGMAASAWPTLPPTATGSPASRKMAPVSSVVVVLPLVPVMPTTGLGRKRQANSTSLHSGTPRRRASCTAALASGTPGLLTSRSASSGQQRPPGR